jgi:hypothetical protein
MKHGLSRIKEEIQNAGNHLLRKTIKRKGQNMRKFFDAAGKIEIDRESVLEWREASKL